MDAEGARIGCERGHCTPTRWSVPPRREAAARHACRALRQPVHFACSSLCEAVLCEGKIGAASAVDDADVTEVEGRCTAFASVPRSDRSASGHRKSHVATEGNLAQAMCTGRLATSIQRRLGVRNVSL